MLNIVVHNATNITYFSSLVFFSFLLSLSRRSQFPFHWRIIYTHLWMCGVSEERQESGINSIRSNSSSRTTETTIQCDVLSISGQMRFCWNVGSLFFSTSYIIFCTFDVYKYTRKKNTTRSVLFTYNSLALKIITHCKRRRQRKTMNEKNE